MKLSKRIRSTVAAFATIAFLASCGTQPKMTKERLPVTIDTSAVTIANIRSWMASRSIFARSLSVSGDITVDQAGDKNSASFAMKSKRIDAGGNRVDSLSIVISGPLGITLARFLASPQQYKFYDILHGQTLTGPTDAHSLEDLTHLGGISLSEMSDIVYGLPGIPFQTDSLSLYSNSETRHVIVAKDNQAHTTAVLELEGTLPNETDAGSLQLTGVRVWNGLIDPMHTAATPYVTVHFSELETVGGFSIPKHLDARAGENSLTLQYDDVQINPDELTVRIKMPQ
ncbi:MAG TPA: hypothetical protein VGM92_07415 [Candidatus Kapabacteria bacterium]